METACFYFFAILTLGCAWLVVANPFSRSQVTSAMFLVLAIVSLAGLFVMLHAYFLAAVQVLVYAGAVIVLFLFVIMLLNVKEEQRRHLRKGPLIFAVLIAAALAAMTIRAVSESRWMVSGAKPGVNGDPIPLGNLLFTHYLLPFEIVSVLLLVGMVGVVLLSKRHLK